MEYCCICANDLSSPNLNSKGKAPLESRKLDCCARTICGRCIYVRPSITPPLHLLHLTNSSFQDNERYAIYCPYCQISSVPLFLPQGLKDPPSYSSKPGRGSRTIAEAPPAYSETNVTTPTDSKSADDEKAALAAAEGPAEDTLHFINHEFDTVVSLSLRYGVPASALRAKNNLTSDHLLLGRRTVLIPGEFYKGGVSLSPRPVEGEEEELRKSKIRRFMTSCKVSDYDIAVLYLEQAQFDLEAAVEAYFADEKWEEEQGKKAGPGTKAGQSHKNRGPFWRGL
ncbi:hypothetical protein HJFPF1_02833 [Paramyrothecium foliicola]|nr:hypothetical protein HJFPF1_02833 [Paramyrothecium foliicola]